MSGWQVPKLGLVLTRRPGERIVIGPVGPGGPVLTVTVVEFRARGQVRIGIDAPRDVPVHRAEVAEAVAGGSPPSGPIPAPCTDGRRA